MKSIIFVFALTCNCAFAQSSGIDCKAIEMAIKYYMFGKALFSDFNPQNLLTIIDTSAMFVHCNLEKKLNVKIIHNASSSKSKDIYIVNLIHFEKKKRVNRFVFFKKTNNTMIEMEVKRRHLFRNKYIVHVVQYGVF